MFKKIASLCFFFPTLTFASRGSANTLYLNELRDVEFLRESAVLISFDAILIIAVMGWIIYLSLFPKGRFILPLLKKIYQRKWEGTSHHQH